VKLLPNGVAPGKFATLWPAPGSFALTSRQAVQPFFSPFFPLETRILLIIIVVVVLASLRGPLFSHDSPSFFERCGRISFTLSSPSFAFTLLFSLQFPAWEIYFLLLHVAFCPDCLIPAVARPVLGQKVFRPFLYTPLLFFPYFFSKRRSCLWALLPEPNPVPPKNCDIDFRFPQASNSFFSSESPKIVSARLISPFQYFSFFICIPSPCDALDLYGVFSPPPRSSFLL